MKFSKTSKRDSCSASVVSLSSQVSLSSKLSGTSKSSKSSMASSLAQAKLATAAAWTSIKKTTSAFKKSCKKTPSSPRPRSVIENPFNDFTYRMDEPTRVSRLVDRLSRQSRYSAIDDNDVQTHRLESYEDSGDDCDIFSGQPFWAGREQSYGAGAAAYNDKMTVVVTTEAHAHGARYANAAPYERIDDEWYL